MNTKTTFILALSLVALGGLYVVTKDLSSADTDARSITRPEVASTTTRDLFEEKLGDITKVVCRKKGSDEWVFEKDSEPSSAGQKNWRMTSPMDMPCVRWEVDKFGSRLGNIEYEISYKPGEPGAVTAAQAGLEPPGAVVTLTDVDGKTVSVEIGNAASAQSTYVRLVGGEEIIAGQADLRGLVKDQALEYREQQLWNFKPESVTRVVIVDRSDASGHLSYVFAKDGARWMMETPVTARATNKVNDLVSQMSRLRAMAWVDDRSDMLAMFGLKEAPLSVTVTVEEQVPVKDADEAAEGDEVPEVDAPKMETKVSTYELHLSDQSPIGEDTKTYMRVGDESAVATIAKTVADKFKPVMSEWRDMRITTVKAAEATQVELSTPQGSATLSLDKGDWTFDPDGGRAETTAMKELLDAVGGLAAVAFVDDATAELGGFGLDQPRAVVRLTIPGVEGAERISIGGFTDQQSKRLVYVRRNELASVGKVRAADVAALLRGPQVYRDRAILDVPPSRLERIALSTENAFDGGRNDITLTRDGNAWSITAPVQAKVREEQMDKLIEALGGLRAEQVVADEGEASAFGLHAPSVTVSLTHKPPVEVRDEKPSEDGGEPKRVEVQPPSQTLMISVAAHDGKYYAQRSDRGTIYQVSDAFFKELVAEYRSDRVLDFDESKVVAFSIRNGDRTHQFDKVDDRWVYQSEPDLPLDSKKVEALLLQLRDLRTSRIVRYQVADLSKFDLSAPQHEVAATLDGGAKLVLHISTKRADQGTEQGYFATTPADSTVFIMAYDVVKRIAVSLDQLEQS
jgi:hypothetical protein